MLIFTEPKTFAKDFSSGYLIGEVLHKYNLQSDFSLFMKKDTAVSKLNNFTRLEPTLRLLRISFDTITAQDLMEEKPGVASRLLYQLYTSLEKNKKAEVSTTMMEIMQPATSAGQFKKEHEIFSERLHQVVKCDAELKLQKISQHYEEKGSNFHTNVFLHDLHLLSSSGQPFPPDYHPGGSRKGVEVSGGEKKVMLQSNTKYIQEIRQRLEENAVASDQRDKRLNSFLMEQLKARDAQEEARREEQLIARLTRQTRQEQRLAAQLLQLRKQKDVIRENRLLREQQYQQRRERDFQEALDREAALAQQARLEREDDIRMQLELCKRMAAERAQSRRTKHSNICADILEQILDLTTKIGEYWLINQNLIPEKQMREWKELLFNGLPLYEPVKGHQPEFLTSLDPVEKEKQEILNNQDYDDYTNLTGDWAWPEEAGEAKSSPLNNDILGHVIQRLRTNQHQSSLEEHLPSFPPFTIKACVLSKYCAGKMAFLPTITEGMELNILSADMLVNEALNAYKEEQLSQILPSSVLSSRAMKGALAEKELSEGNTISNELLVEIITEAIRELPAHSGWILDGFPLDITQAQLLEKALCGSVEEEKEDKIQRTNLAVDSNPPEPPPPSAPALDLALLLDFSDEQMVSHALSSNNSFTYNTEVKETSKRSADASDEDWQLSTFVFHRMSDLNFPFRIIAFQDAWPELEEWFGHKQNILVRVEVDVVDEEFYSKVKSVLQQVMEKRQKGNNTRSVLGNYETVMERLRYQRTVFDHHNYIISERFKHILGRPDSRQELVSQMQKDFNNVPDDMRDDEENKTELHLRLDELRERLWDICDKRKEEDEQERATIMSDGWLEEQVSVVINLHSLLMQVITSFFIIFSAKNRLNARGVHCHESDDMIHGLHVTIRYDVITLYCNINNYKFPQYNGFKWVSNIIIFPSVPPGVQSPTPSISQEVNDKIQQEHTAALQHEGVYTLFPNTHHIFKFYMCNSKSKYLSVYFLESAAKVRIALVKGHGLVMVRSLQSGVDECFGSMEKMLQEGYLTEMKSIDKLSEVVRHNIEAGTKLQNELVLGSCDFYLNGDHRLFESPPPPLRPPASEKPTGSTLTVVQLESLNQQLRIMAPSGSSTSHKGTNPTIEQWIEINERQVEFIDIVFLLTDDHEMVDWRRFLLSAALPWPPSSLSQLLEVLEKYKALDTSGSSYITEQQYAQIELWFSGDCNLVVPDDPSEPLPYDRLSNLCRFFFQLFADHEATPPKLNYMHMLLYFAADSNPRTGFIRALSLVLGQHLKDSSSSSPPSYLVKVSEITRALICGHPRKTMAQ
uniref:Sperm flagellar 2 n=1 Tax=Gouania willdenowi TaxID=441366 RepID=A0A8C5HAY3_GOUWI